MDEQEKLRVLSGRLAVNAYRLAHSQLHLTGWHKGIPEERTPLLNASLAELKKQGFGSLDEFFAASEELNTKELGFRSTGDFGDRATEADIEALDRMWH